jgi:orotate phosphoribosyltransferase
MTKDVKTPFEDSQSIGLKGKLNMDEPICTLSREVIKAELKEDLGSLLSKKALLRLLKISGGYWKHDGHGPHALLTRGDHSDSFVMSKKLLLDATIRQIVIEQLDIKIKVFMSQEPDLVDPDYIVAVPTGANPLATGLSKEFVIPTINLKRNESGFAVIDDNEPDLEDITVLVVEDVINTGWSVSETLYTLLLALTNNVSIFPRIFCIVNRGGLTHINIRLVPLTGGNNKGPLLRIPIIALIDESMSKWKPEECPLCAQGSVAISPKEGNNWNEHFLQLCY